MNYSTLHALHSKYLQIREQLDSINNYLNNYLNTVATNNQFRTTSIIADTSWSISNISCNVQFSIPRDIAETLLARSKTLLETELQDLKNRLNITD